MIRHFETSLLNKCIFSFVQKYCWKTIKVTIMKKEPKKKDLYNKTCCGFFLGSNQYSAGRVNGLCVYFMTGAYMHCFSLVCFFSSSYNSHLISKTNLNLFLFSHINISVNGNNDILSFSFTFNTFYWRTKSVIILIFYCLLLFSFNFVIEFLQKKSRNAVF